jgi:hypothetical protein
VAHTDAAVVAKLEDPALHPVRLGLFLGIMGLVALCVLALLLVHRARSQPEAYPQAHPSS